MKIGRALRKEEKIYRSSDGAIAVMPDDHESITICQRLEEIGFSLLEGCLGHPAVVIPQGRVLTRNEVKTYTDKNKFNSRSKISRVMFAAFSYLIHSRMYY